MRTVARRLSSYTVSTALFTMVVALCAASSLAVARAKDDSRSTLVVLWRDPGAIATRDLFWGSGAAARAPRPPFEFEEEDKGGTQPKVVVTDAEGTVWDVKFGPEAHAEVAANRIVWALGYFVDELYFVPEGTIRGVRKLGRAEKVIAPDGNFREARFKRRDPERVRLKDSWSFAQNPFHGKPELAGLQVLMTLLCNWDIEDGRNNGIVEVTVTNGRRERWYMVADLGATFGRMGNRLSNHSKWDIAGFREERFVDKIDGDELELDFDGLESGLDAVPIAHARWFATLIGQLTPAQLRQAFTAAGATREETEVFATRLEEKIKELQMAVGTRTPADISRR